MKDETIVRRTLKHWAGEKVEWVESGRGGSPGMPDAKLKICGTSVPCELKFWNWKFQPKRVFWLGSHVRPVQRMWHTKQARSGLPSMFMIGFAWPPVHPLDYKTGEERGVGRNPDGDDLPRGHGLAEFLTPAGKWLGGAGNMPSVLPLNPIHGLDLYAKPAYIYGVFPGRDVPMDDRVKNVSLWIVRSLEDIEKWAYRHLGGSLIADRLD